MNGLLKKYYNDSLTPAELAELNSHLAEAPEDEVTDEMMEAWSFDIDTSAINGDRIAAVKERVDNRIGDEVVKERHSTAEISSVGLWLYRAVAVLLPLFVLSTIYLLYNDRAEEVMPSQPVAVYTARGERASVQLPDGTNVVLSYDSRLEYDASRFAASRDVKFSGEAYFNALLSTEKINNYV